jgi:hypothetical protein
MHGALCAAEGRERLMYDYLPHWVTVGPMPLPGTYRYRLSSTGGGSAKYGPCEVCRGNADTVYLQTEERAYTVSRPEITDGRVEGFTGHKCHTYFGHRECLLSKRRTPRLPDDAEEVPVAG